MTVTLDAPTDRFASYPGYTIQGRNLTFGDADVRDATILRGICIECRATFAYSGPAVPFWNAHDLVPYRPADRVPLWAWCPCTVAATGNPTRIIWRVVRGILDASKRCGGGCVTAKSLVCRCSCGGHNHGAKR